MNVNFKSLFTFLITISFAGLIHAKDLDITKYGAVGDGKTLNTQFIQNAIDECSKTGGGKVIFPAGKFLSGTIVLKDNIVIYLEKDAILLGSTDVNDYQNMDPFAECRDPECKSKSFRYENSKGIDASKNKLPGIKKLIKPAPETGKLSNSSQF
jgi:polygalacturonase